jgi:hypothetical protein
MRLALYIILVTFLLAIPSNAQTEVKTADTGNKPPAEKPGLSDDDTVRKIIFDRVIKDYRSNSKVYYLSVDGEKDPGDDFLALFSGLNVTAKKGSESPLFEHLDIKSDAPKRESGPFYMISKLVWISKDEVSATAGTALGNIGGNWCKYTLSRENGQWKIVSATECVVD